MSTKKRKTSSERLKYATKLIARLENRIEELVASEEHLKHELNTSVKARRDLENLLTDYRKTVLWARSAKRVTSCLYPRADMPTKHAEAQLLEQRVIVAAQLGFDAVLKSDDDGLKLVLIEAAKDPRTGNWWPADSQIIPRA